MLNRILSTSRRAGMARRPRQNTGGAVVPIAIGSVLGVIILSRRGTARFFVSFLWGQPNTDEI